MKFKDNQNVLEFFRNHCFFMILSKDFFNFRVNKKFKIFKYSQDFTGNIYVKGRIKRTIVFYSPLVFIIKSLISKPAKISSLKIIHFFKSKFDYYAQQQKVVNGWFHLRYFIFKESDVELLIRQGNIKICYQNKQYNVSLVDYECICAYWDFVQFSYDYKEYLKSEHPIYFDVSFDYLGRIYYRGVFSPSTTKLVRNHITSFSGLPSQCLDVKGSFIFLSSLLSCDLNLLSKVYNVFDSNNNSTVDPYEFLTSGVTGVNRKTKKQAILFYLNGMGCAQIKIKCNLNSHEYNSIVSKVRYNLKNWFCFLDIVKKCLDDGYNLCLRSKFMAVTVKPTEPRYKLVSIFCIFFESFLVHSIQMAFIKESYSLFTVHDCYIISDDAKYQSFLFTHFNDNCMMLIQCFDKIVYFEDSEGNRIVPLVYAKFLQERDQRVISLVFYEKYYYFERALVREE